MKVLVCGGRTYSRKKRLFEVLDFFHKRAPISLIVHGDASGADSLAKEWAIERGVPHKPYPADWRNKEGRTNVLMRLDRYGRKYDVLAGHSRNQKMLDEQKPKLVIAFPGQNGTADMIMKAKRARIEVVEIRN